MENVAQETEKAISGAIKVDVRFGFETETKKAPPDSDGALLVRADLFGSTSRRAGWRNNNGDNGDNGDDDGENDGDDRNIDDDVPIRIGFVEISRHIHFTVLMKKKLPAAGWRGEVDFILNFSLNRRDPAQRGR